MEFVELLDKMFLIDTIKFLFRYLQFFQRFKSFIHTIGFTKSIRIGLVQSLNKQILTVLSSYNNFLATPNCLLMILNATLES